MERGWNQWTTEGITMKKGILIVAQKKDLDAAEMQIIYKTKMKGVLKMLGTHHTMNYRFYTFGSNCVLAKITAKTFTEAVKIFSKHHAGNYRIRFADQEKNIRLNTDGTWACTY